MFFLLGYFYPSGVNIPKLNTLSKRTTFVYTPDDKGGFYIEYSGRPHVTKEMIEKIQREFRTRTVPGGFGMTNPIPGGFGEWIRDNTPYTPRHGFHIAAVLKEMGIIKDAYGKRPIILRF